MKPTDIARLAAIAALHFALLAIPTALYGDTPALRGGNAVVVFLLLLAPRRHWILVAPLLWLAAGGARAVLHAPQPWLVAACNTLEVLAVAAILHGRRGLDTPWYGHRQLPRLLLAAVGVPVLSGAAVATLLHGGVEGLFAAQWRGWTLASTLAYVILMPFLLSWAAPAVRADAPAKSVARDAAGIGLVAILCVALVRQELYGPLVLLAFPLAVLVTWWYRLAGTTALLAVLSICGGWFAARHVGALFDVLPPGADMAERVHLLHLFLGAVVLCTLPFAVLLAEQDRLWAQLRRKSDARAEFLAAMSHEIRTPMTGVLGMADLLAAQQLTPVQRRYVDAMRSSGRHLVNVINDILDFSRIETGRLVLEQVDFRLSEMIEQVRSLMHPAAVDKGLTFDARLAPGLPDVVRGDPTRLRQILLNLAGNAVKFTSQGQVSVEIDADADTDGTWRHRFRVQDTGIGIPADKLPLLFTPFTQADRSTAREYGGSGLGLAISRRLAEAMGGRIDVRSTPGQGSTFTLELPLPAGDPAYRGAADAEAAPAPSPQRILVAEDVPINRDILRMSLGARGHRVVFAADGAEALELVQRQPFDMVLMDVQMPVMDGVEATRRIRALGGALGRIPIIGLTANVMTQEQARYLQAGMDECLMKPIEWDRLAAAIARHASREHPGWAAEGGVGDDDEDAAPREPDDVPLLEEGQIASLRGIATESEFVQLMHRSIETAQRAVDEIAAAREARPMASAAHRLRGSAGMAGLARISFLAGVLEEACEEGGDVAEVRRQLAESVQRTRDALARRLEG